MKRSSVSIIAGLFLLVAISGAASAANPLRLNVNGKLLTDSPSPLISNQMSYVPIRTVESLGNQVVWEGATKTVSIQNRSTKDRLSLTVGSTIAVKNKEKLKLAAPLVVKGNTIYVPLRFIGEQFGAVVDWDAKNNGLVVVTPDPTVQAQIRSGDLAQARLAVVRMPKISFYSSPEHPEGHANSYIFPENDYSKYYFQLNGSIFYYELKNGYMSLAWEGKLTVPSKGNSSSTLAKYLNAGLETVWGEQPKVTKPLIFFNDHIFVRDSGDYGIIDTNGSVTFTHTVQDAKQLSDIIVNFSEEKGSGTIDPMSDPSEVRGFLQDNQIPNGDIYLKDGLLYINLVQPSDKGELLLAKRYTAGTYKVVRVTHSIEELRAAQDKISSPELFNKLNLYASDLDVIKNKIIITMPESSEAEAKPAIEKLIDPSLIEYDILKLSEKPDVVGSIAKIDKASHRILVLEDGKTEPSYWFGFDDHSELADSSGRSITFDDLKEKVHVRVWIKGGVDDSFPAQAGTRRLELVSPQ